MGPHAPVTALVGRGADVALMKQLVRDVTAGRGRAVWVEGGVGIGKSSVVAAGLAEAGAAGCGTGWAEADEFTLRSPLRVLLDCLDITVRSPDPRRARIVSLLRGEPVPEVPDVTDPVRAAMEGLLALVDELCGVQPLILVVDDIHWADETSLIAWHRLAQCVEQLPLLLVAVCRSLPQRASVVQLRKSVLSRGGVRIELDPLPPPDVAALVARLVGASPSPRLLRLVGDAAGNPLYIRELIDVLLADGGVVAGPTGAEPAGPESDRIPTSLASTVTRSLRFLPAPLREMLGAATLLGQQFTLTDLARVVSVRPSGLLTGVRQARAAGVVVESGTGLRFRHPLIRQALYDDLPSALRVALHRQAAQALATSGAPAEEVAQQLLAGSLTVDRWVLDWAAVHAAVLTRQAPRVAADLLQQMVDRSAGAGTEQHDVIVAALAAALFRLGRHEEAEKQARNILARSRDDVRTAEMRWVLALVLFGDGRNDQARAVVDQGLRSAALPRKWRARFQALSSMFSADAGDLDGALAGAQQALHASEAAGDPLGTGYALRVLWLIASVRHDHVEALRFADRCLAVLSADPQHPEARSWAVRNRAFTLQNLDRLPEARITVRDALAQAEQSGDAALGTLNIASAVYDYWAGRWEDAMASLESVTAQDGAITHLGSGERRAALLVKDGLAALIAGHRDERDVARRHLQAGLAQSNTSVPDREHHEFLIVAQALAAERDGAADRALAILAPLLDRRPGQVSLTRLWLPDIVRLAVDVGDTAAAQAALKTCEEEAALERLPAQAARAADRCRGLLLADPAPLLGAAEHYAAVGRPFERAQSLEDAAVVLARQGHLPDARAALAEAVGLYTDLGAVWDVRRADTRIRPHGVRRGVRGPRPRASFGWQALSSTELKVARLVAEGKTNPEIAASMFLSRRTVQTHVSHILAKLNARSRVEIATETQRHHTAREDTTPS